MKLDILDGLGIPASSRVIRLLNGTPPEKFQFREAVIVITRHSATFKVL